MTAFGGANVGIAMESQRIEQDIRTPGYTPLHIAKGKELVTVSGEIKRKSLSDRLYEVGIEVTYDVRMRTHKTCSSNKILRNNAGWSELDCLS